MADVIPISGGPEEAKIRNVVGVVVLGFITLGIYAIVWWYKINREMADLGRKHGREDLGDSPLKSVLAITIGVLLIVPAILSIVNTWKRMKRAQQLVGVPETEQGNAVIYALLLLFTGSIAYGYLQNELNKVWRLQPGAGLPDAAVAAAVAPATPAAAAESPTSLPGIPGN